MQGGEGVLGDGTLVHITPHLQAHQSHTDIQSPVELKRERCGFRFRSLLTFLLLSSLYINLLNTNATQSLLENDEGL